MAKQVINNDGQVVFVSGGTLTKNIDGKDYLLTPEEESERATLRSAYAAEASERAEAKVIATRKAAYGTADEQLEYIAENGIQAFQNRQQAIKSQHPKGD